MKKIIKRRKTFRVNNPLAFGILCAMILIFIGGGVYALAAGVAMPAVKEYQDARATPSPTPTDAPLTPTPTPTTVPTPTVDPNATPTPTPTPDGVLNGHVIGIDPARGISSKIKGVSTGIYANRLNYAIAELVKTRLEALGAKVIVPLASVQSDMDSVKRAEIMNSNSVELAVRIECNYVENTKTRGALMWTGAAHKNLDESDKLAAAVFTQYIKATDLPTRPYKDSTIRHKEDDSFLSGNTAPACTLIMGHISNADDDKALNDEDLQKKIADAIVQGILNYLGIKS